jgi:uncharacterized membrane protein YqgA involved in biofilm formation
VTCTILFCAAAMIPALQDGLQNDPRLLIKAVMDGLGTLAFAKVFGPADAVGPPVLAYQA